MSIKKLWRDYQETRASEQEVFLEWYLKRIASDWVRLTFSLLLCASGLYLASSPRRVVYLFHLVVFLSLLVVIWEVWDKRKGK